MWLMEKGCLWHHPPSNRKIWCQPLFQYAPCRIDDCGHCDWHVHDGFHKPVAEIQFADYMWTESIRFSMKLRASITVRMESGQFHRHPDALWRLYSGGPYHSQSVEAFLAHCPGLKVVIPSNAADAKGLLKTAIQDPNPVIFLEHKALYRQQKFCARPEPSKETLIPFGQAAIVREGTDLTLVCWGMMVVMAGSSQRNSLSKGFL